MFKLLLKKRSLLPSIIIVLIAGIINIGNAQAQNGTATKQEITGKVTDSNDGQSLPGVNVFIKGTTMGAVTDLDGNFAVTASSNDIIVVSYVGYITQEVEVGNKTTLDVKLDLDQAQLEEVVVVGYGIQQKSHVTGSIAKMENSEYLSQMPANRIDDVLKGQLAGVQIQSTNSQAGEAPTITIRGTSSVNSSNSPLVVVDGYPIPGDLSTIDMHNVESIEVLKDAASAAIYGSRGSNGVILVTTKSGQSGKTTFTFNAAAGVTSIYEQPNYYPTPSEWTDFVNSSASDASLIPDQIAAMNSLGTYTNTEDIVFDNGTMQNYNLSASGGNENVNFFISGGYQKDDGIIITNNYEKYNLNAKVNAKINDWIEAGMSIIPSYSRQRVSALGLHDMLRNQPWLPQYHTEETVGYAAAAGYDVEVGDWAHERHFDNVDGVQLRVTSNNNAIAKTLGKYRYYNNYQVNANSYLKFQLAENLTFRTSFGSYASYYESEYYQAAWSHRNEENYGTYAGNLTTDILNENTLSYDKKFGDHFLSALAGFTYQSTRHTYSNIETSDFLTDQIQTLNGGTVIDVGSTSKTQSNLLSTLYRVGYVYKNKYLLNTTVRWDGSSRFGSDNKWGFFPSVSVGWNAGYEDFMKEQDVVSRLKFRASYGATGNNNVGDYAAQALLSPTASAVFDGSVVQGFTQDNIANPSLSWERTFEFDFGTDIGFFDNKILMNIDYYKKTTDKLLLYKDIPAVTGFTNLWDNVGEVQNEGIEIELTGHVIDNNDLTWDIGFNFAHNKNTLTDLGGADEIISTPDSKRPSQFIARVGDPIVQFYGYVVDYEVDEDDMTSPYWPVNVGAANVYVKDLNGDGEITTEDRTVLGDPYPDFNWGFTNAFTFGDFDVYMLWQGSQGGSVYNIDSYYLESQWKGGNVSDIENADFLQNKVVTDWNVQDASYASLRNLTVGYTFPKRFFENSGFTNLRVYASVQNLVYLTAADYTGMNPEGINLYDETLTYGYQRGASPVARSFVVGLDINL